MSDVNSDFKHLYTDVNSDIRELYEIWNEIVTNCRQCDCKCEVCNDCPCDLHICRFAEVKYIKALEAAEKYFQTQDLAQFVDDINDLGLAWDIQFLKYYINDENIKAKLIKGKDLFVKVFLEQMEEGYEADVETSQ
jgi:hypothetical protein